MQIILDACREMKLSNLASWGATRMVGLSMRSHHGEVCVDPGPKSRRLQGGNFSLWQIGFVERIARGPFRKLDAEPWAQPPILLRDMVGRETVARASTSVRRQWTLLYGRA